MLYKLLFLVLVMSSTRGLFAQNIQLEPASSTSMPEVDSRLKNAIEPLVRAHSGDVAIAIRNLDTGEHYEFNASTPMPTASLIKLPVLIALYQLSDSNQIDLNQLVELRDEEKVPGSGVLTEHFSAGIKLPLVDYARLMIRYSDNTATNVVADAIGLNTTAQKMDALGLNETKLHSKVYRGSTTVFPERSKQYGIGSTTAREMVQLLDLLHAGKLLSPKSNAAVQQHLLSCEDDTKLQRNFPREVKYAHKTGEIANCRTDAGIVYTSSGPIAVCFLTNRNEDQEFSDDNQAHLLAGKIGQVILERFGSPSGDDTLREGAYGQLVEVLQRTLNARLTPSPSLSIDGDFGPATRQAVLRFQRANKLPETGVVTSDTWSALGTLIESDEPVPPPEVVNSEQLPLASPIEMNGTPFVTCKAWIVTDLASGQELFESASQNPLPPASTTKIMTAYLVIRHAQQHPEILDERVTFSPRADNTVGSTAAVRAGESVTVRELLYGLLLPSGNDAAVALAEHFGSRLTATSSSPPASDDAYQSFVAAMNWAANELGMEQANFMNPHGLPHEEHVISARDLAKLASAAMRFDLFSRIVSTRQFGCIAFSEKGYQRNMLWKNTNRLLAVEGFRGVKTGTTSAAGACLVSCGAHNGRELLVVVLGSSSSDARYADTQNLFRWAQNSLSSTSPTN